MKIFKFALAFIILVSLIWAISPALAQEFTPPGMEGIRERDAAPPANVEEDNAGTGEWKFQIFEELSVVNEEPPVEYTPNNDGPINAAIMGEETAGFSYMEEQEPPYIEEAPSLPRDVTNPQDSSTSAPLNTVPDFLQKIQEKLSGE